MRLRHKFGLLALLYGVTLAANVTLCAWCLLLYYQSFLGQASAEARLPIWPGSPPDPAPGDLEAAESADPDMDGSAWLGQADVAAILAANGLCGVALGALGLRLGRRWVMSPVANLRRAAEEFGHGHLSHRAAVASRDELGELAATLNAMAASILRMQAELVEQERRKVAAQALRCIVHNIRSPLTGVRWLAEAVTMRPGVDADTLRDQGLIVEAVDGVLSWLQEFRKSLEEACAPGGSPGRAGTLLAPPAAAQQRGLTHG